MSCQTFAQELANLPPNNFNFKALTKEQVIEKIQKALQASSPANIVINKQNYIIMKYVEEKLETFTSQIEDADAPVPASAPTPASAPASTAVKKTFASFVKTTQFIIVKASDNDVVEGSKAEMLSKANEALKKITLETVELQTKVL